MSEIISRQPELILNPENPAERRILLQEREFAFVQRQANLRASSDIVPQQFRGKIANCVIAMEMASRLGVGEMEIMQNLYVVHGNPAFSAKYLIALVNKSGVLKGRLKFRFSDDRSSCQAYGTCSETGEELAGTSITLAMAAAEGWTSKSGSKWKTMPDQMLMYRAASFWSRTYAPDATMGMYSVEELVDIEEKDITPKVSRISELITPAPVVDATEDGASADDADEIAGRDLFDDELDGII